MSRGILFGERRIPICVHLSCRLQIVVIGLFSHNRLAFPTAKLIQDRWPTTPVGISPCMYEPFGDLLPTVLCLGALEVEGLGDRLARDRKLQGQTPGVQRRLGPGHSLLWRAG